MGKRAECILLQSTAKQEEDISLVVKCYLKLQSNTSAYLLEMRKLKMTDNAKCCWECTKIDDSLIVDGEAWPAGWASVCVLSITEIWDICGQRAPKPVTGTNQKILSSILPA